MPQFAIWIAGLALAFAPTAWAQAPYDDEKTPEGWAWAHIRNDEVVDFNEKYGEKLDPQKDGTNWDRRRISAKFLVDVLTVPVWRDQIRRHSVRLSGALIDEPIELSDSDIIPALEIKNSRIDAGLQLVGAHWDRFLSIFGSRIKDKVNLERAKIGGALIMDKSTLPDLNARSLKVEGDFYLQEARINGNVILDDAQINGNLWLDRTLFCRDMNADSVHVAATVHMQGSRSFMVNYRAAKIGDIFRLDEANVVKFDFSEAAAREFWLNQLSWKNASDIASLCVAAGVSKADQRSTIHWLLGHPDWQKVKCQRPPDLILRNAHVGALQDSDDAWPPCMDLEGFQYDRLGGAIPNERNDMRKRSPELWTDWLARDPTFSTQPYTQLSTVLLAAGNRESAEAIQFAERERGRAEAWKHGNLGNFAWQTILFSTAGYGIGLHTFRVLWWVGGITMLGAVVLGYSPNAHARGWPWRIGASLHRLLPVVELSKEFKDFFDNPQSAQSEPRNLNRLQMYYFAGHALLGWILGFFLLAAMGVLTQKG